MRVDVGHFTKQAGVGNQDIDLTMGGTVVPPDLTAAPAGSWAIVFCTAGSDTASGTWFADIYSSLGFVANGGGTISEYAVSTSHRDAFATSDTARRMAAKCITLTNSSGAGVTYEANFTSFPTATSMRINWSTNVATAQVINYMIVSGLTGAKVVNWTTPLTAINKAVTGVGFNPDLVLHAHTAQTSLGSGTYGYMGFGAMNKHGQQWTNAFSSNDGANPSNTSRWQQTDACVGYIDPGEVLRKEAHFVSMDADGFTTNFSTVDGAAGQVISLCLDGVSSKIGAYAIANATTQTVDSRQGFIPKAALFSTVANAPAGAPATNTIWSLGASDLTNQRAAGLFDSDAVGTTRAASLWYSNKALSIITALGASPGDTDLSLSSVTADSMSLAYDTATANSQEIAWLLLGDAGTDTFPSTVQSEFVTNSAATAYSNQKKAVELSMGRKVAMVHDATTQARFEWSDDGVTWTNYAADILGPINGSIDSYVDSGGTERLVAVWKQSGTGGGRTDGRIYAMIGAFNAGRTTLTWGTAVEVNASTSSDYPDIVTHAEDTGGKGHIIYSQANAVPQNFANYARLDITNGGVPTLGTDISLSPNHGVNVHTFPSIDYDPATKRLFVVWSAGATGAGKGIRFRTASYAAGVWTWAAEVEVDTTHVIDSNQHTWMICRWDGTRIILAARVSGGTDGVYQWESTAFTAGSFTKRTIDSGLVSFSDFYSGHAVVDSATGDVYYIGIFNASPNFGLAYAKWTRATLSLGAIAMIDTGVGFPSSYVPYVNAFPISNGIGWIYTRGNNSPYAVAYDRILLNVPPNVPINLVQSSATTDTTPQFTCDISDPNATQNIKARFKLYQNDGTTLIGTVDSALRTGAGSVSAEYTSALPVGTYKVKASTIDALGSESADTAFVTFYVRTAVTDDIVALWDVRHSIAEDLVLSWNVNISNQKDLALLWNTFANVAPEDLTLLWRTHTYWTPVDDTVESTTWVEVP